MKTKNRNIRKLKYLLLLGFIACTNPIIINFDYQDFAESMDKRVMRKEKYGIWNTIPPNGESPLYGYKSIIAIGAPFGSNPEKIVDEGENKRYYLYYYNWPYKPRFDCYFSVLFGADGTILSWRFENDRYKEECKFSEALNAKEADKEITFEDIQ